MADSADGQFQLGQISAKLDLILQRLDKQDERHDHHETRIRAMETELADRSGYKVRFHDCERTVDRLESDVATIQTTASNIKTAIQVLWAIGGTSTLAVIGFAIKLWIGS